MPDHAKMDGFIRDFLADPQAFKRKWEAEIRKERPEMTDKQIDASWEQLAHQLGL